MKTRKKVDDQTNQSKPIIIPTVDKIKMKKENMKKKRSQTKNKWHDWLINFIFKPIKNDGQCFRKNF